MNRLRKHGIDNPYYNEEVKRVADTLGIKYTEAETMPQEVKVSNRRGSASTNHANEAFVKEA